MSEEHVHQGVWLTYTQLIQQQIRRQRRWRRSIRATWRDTSALWSEFRLPVLLFLFVVLVGGFVYGELYAYAINQREFVPVDMPHTIALIDRPYIMMQLMILETPGDAPPEWYLVIFWYAMPIMLVIIAGLGAVDFVHLFFHRSGRRDAWRQAVASTYRNHIIVFGAGHVGMRVITSLVQMGLDVLVVDNDPDEGVEDTLAKMGVPLLVGDGRLTVTLEKAGLRHAESFVSCTGDDHTNLEVIMKVRDMNPNVRIVTRMWDDQFAKQLQQFLNVYRVLSSSDLAAPAFAAAALGIEITQTLTIGGVDYSMLRLTVEPGSYMEGQNVGHLQTTDEMDIVLHSVGAEAVVQPHRETVVKAGDTLVIFARHTKILSVVARNNNRKGRKYIS